MEERRPGDGLSEGLHNKHQMEGECCAGEWRAAVPGERTKDFEIGTGGGRGKYACADGDVLVIDCN